MRLTIISLFCVSMVVDKFHGGWLPATTPLTRRIAGSLFVWKKCCTFLSESRLQIASCCLRIKFGKLQKMQNGRALSKRASRKAQLDWLIAPGRGRPKKASRKAQLDWLPATVRGLKSCRTSKNNQTMQNWSIFSKIGKKKSLTV